MLQVSQLHGFNAGGKAPIVFIDSSFATTSTITIPSTAAVGDLAVGIDHAVNSDGGTAPTTAVLTGFTSIINNSETAGFGSRMITSYKILVGGDPGSSVTGMNDNIMEKAILIFRYGFTVATPNTWSGQITNGDPTLQSVTASGGTPPLIVFGCAGSQAGTVTFTTQSPAFEAELVAASNDLRIGYTIYMSAPQDHSVDTDDQGADSGLQTGYIALS